MAKAGSRVSPLTFRLDTEECIRSSVRRRVNRSDETKIGQLAQSWLGPTPGGEIRPGTSATQTSVSQGLEVSPSDQESS
jgi:hypothetical protein